MLLSNDTKYLTERAIEHSVATEANMTCLVLPRFSLPSGFDQNESDLLLRFSPGYPDVAPDMWWFDPAIRRADGIPIAATDVIEHYLGRSWQRWSRHLIAGQWRSGIDGLENFLALVRRELERSVPELVQ